MRWGPGNCCAYQKSYAFFFLSSVLCVDCAMLVENPFLEYMVMNGQVKMARARWRPEGSDDDSEVVMPQHT
ncbi:hypothetical protein LSCM4_00207 [Leishmania orientalis]|uniref:Uncharacterized protein n=1 Tax=Leishmania orientalis TaxID=2249476 RepID=A0A836K968_9TRYP|nr:hypothetical protein LSCM4_00207 [Leishmania orientalis]